MQDILSNALNCVMNAKRAGKESCTVPSSKVLLSVLEIMKKNDYITGYKDSEGKAEIKIGKLNHCQSIKPRYYIKKDQFDKYVRRFLPSRDFGVLIVSTSRGMLTHNEAIEKNTGGSLIAFCF